MSYGWAVLVVVVLGIVLYNLGAFSPSQAPVASGFSVVQPKSWSASSPSGSSTVTGYNISITNAGGKDLTVNASLLNVSKTGCGAYLNIVNVTDDSGNALASSYTNGVGGTSFTWGAGSLVKVNVFQIGNGCAGVSGQSFRVKFVTGTMIDTYGISVSDNGYLSGKQS
jgi:hypothetical protein